MRFCASVRNARRAMRRRFRPIRSKATSRAAVDENALHDCWRGTTFVQQAYSGSHVVDAGDIDPQVDIYGGEAVCSLIHSSSIAELDACVICQKTGYAPGIQARRWRNGGWPQRFDILCFCTVQ